MKKGYLRIIAIMLVLILLGGCSSAIPTPEESAQPSEDPGEYTDEVFEATILDDDYVCVKAIGASWDERNNYLLAMSFENKTGRSVSYEIEPVAVNGVMCSGSLYVTVHAYSTSEETIELTGSELTSYGITNPSMITGLIDIYDAMTFETGDLPSAQSFVIYPDGIENAVFQAHHVEETEQTLYSDDRIDMICSDAYVQQGDLYVDTVLQNDTDTLMQFHVLGGTLNDVECDSIDVISVLPHCYAYASIIWGEDYLEETEIDPLTVKKVSLDWKAVDQLSEDKTVLWEDTTEFTVRLLNS